ncbi:tRNA 5-methylaminomethyl-2-thiouridine biosynthesis bifunctional protein MnmC [Halomicronema hongdechloris C2206]|uniref:tRNA 5-methylaminomethyl-2-thiouridine biosynthesis bifunctional protein MnmC n=1 Tax=Halomicronema hongdechloris C2206 TaxID=1641165 RepID=A0A1Z3HPM7_9CYAN|nr:MnmC family methyltransferase [Halomicronema hongdechloris]ASC72117.1 tRNA 5-methylaminomethyl-2-thiouridine biosynthesis bifunctional protein MnmC [Halomicronema hongdechloris C2206]
MVHHPLVPYDDFAPELTADGSFTFYSETFDEGFHSAAGAYQEARHTYGDSTRLCQKAFGSRLCLLDVCYGLGYNSAAALDIIWQTNPTCRVTLVGLELDARVPVAAVEAGFTEGWSPDTQAILKQLAHQHTIQTDYLEARLLIGDARQTIQPLVKSGFQADAIFFDPFSPPHCPQLWTVEFIAQVAHCLKPAGYLATYSCAAAVRTAFQQTGLSIGAIPAAGRRWSGTLVNWSGIGLPALTQREQEHLDTKAAVPYRDPTLKDTAEAIQQRRRQEQQTSPLRPTGQWRKRWLGRT